MSLTSSKRPYFEYGRHETFTIRHGWLGKGIERVLETGGFRSDLTTADALGLGSRMVKSLQYWLEATELVEGERAPSEAKPARSRAKSAQLSSVGEVVHKKDPFFEYPATWWFIHLALASREGSVWAWFFNDFQDRSFDRADCIAAFQRYLRDHAANPTTPATAQRDIACLLLSYAAPSANEQHDPEDGTVCPLRDLGLVMRHADTGRFERARPLNAIPIEAFLACADRAIPEGEETISINDLLRRRFGPGRLLGMNGDMIDQMATKAAELYRHEGVTFTLHGAERRLRLPMADSSLWLNRHFDRIGIQQ